MIDFEGNGRIILQTARNYSKANLLKYLAGGLQSFTASAIGVRYILLTFCK